MFSIPTPQTLAAKALIAVVGVAIVAGAGAYGGYRFEHGRYVELQLADAKANTDNLRLQSLSDAQQAKISLDAAVTEAHYQGTLDAQTIQLNAEIPKYVTSAQDHGICGLTVGLARVLRATAEGVSPAALSLPAGQSDDDCSDLTPSEVAGWFAAYDRAAKGNAEQLTALERWIVANHAAQIVK